MCYYSWSNHIATGFVKVNADFNLPIHEDTLLINRYHPSKYYSDWMFKTSHRKCAIMIPISGDFKNVYTCMYDKDRNKLASFNLEHGPVLYVTGSGIAHGADNRGMPERITYQISFKEEYDVIKKKISALGFTKV